MSSVINVVLELLEDGHPATDSPFVSTALVEQWQTLNVQKSVDLPGVYAPIPTVAAFPIIQALLFFNIDQDVTYRVQGQTDSGIPVAAGGMLLLMNPNIDVERLNILVNNPDAPATIVGFVGGKGIPLVFPEALNLVIDERWEGTPFLLYDRSFPSNIYEVIFHGPPPDPIPNQIEVVPASGPATGGIILNNYIGGGPPWSYFIDQGQAWHDHSFFADQKPWDGSHTFYVDDATEQLVYFP